MGGALQRVGLTPNCPLPSPPVLLPCEGPPGPHAPACRGHPKAVEGCGPSQQTLYSPVYTAGWGLTCTSMMSLSTLCAGTSAVLEMQGCGCPQAAWPSPGCRPARPPCSGAHRGG